MNRKLRTIALLITFALSSCVDGARTNELVLSGGIGGTGVTTWEGGIGGTGVVGTITGFGSIIINGLHVHYDQNQQVESALGTMTGANFALGQVVSAETQFENGRLVAQRLILQIPLAGPVQSINVQNRTFRVLGETVRVMNGAEFAIGSMQTLRIGEMVAISGLRGDEGIYASRVDPMTPGSRPVISGIVTEVSTTGVTIDGRHRTEVQSAERTRVRVGDYVSLSDVQQDVDGQLHATAVERAYGPMFDGRVNRIALEGVFAGNGHVITGMVPIGNAPKGRAVVFVSKTTDNALQVDGQAMRPMDGWRDTLSIRSVPSRAPDANRGRSPAGDGGRSGGGSSGGGGNGGGSSGGGGGGGNGGGGGGKS